MDKLRQRCTPLVGASIALLLFAVSAQAQTVNSYKPVGVIGSQAPVSNQTLPPAGTENFPIGPGDAVTITVYGEPDMSQQVRVTDSGDIALLMGGSVHVAGLTPEQASLVIAEHLRTANILKNARVSIYVQTVSLQDYLTRGATVIGEVLRPGIAPVTSPRRIIDVISMVGGLTNVAERHITIQHGANPTNLQTVFISNDPKIALENDTVLVNPGDTVIVPRAGIVYVLGDVFRPGGYVMQNESKMTLLQVIAVCGGANTTAAKGGARLIRKANGQYAEVPLHLKDIEKGKAPDVQLMADDVLYIPFSFGRHILLGSGSILPAAASASIYAATTF